MSTTWGEPDDRSTGISPEVQPEANGGYPARVYHYWLTGAEITPADKEAAKWALRFIPELRDYAVGNLQFLARATSFVVGLGIRQFLDIGSGFLSSPNVHEIAQAADPASRVVYVSNDEMVHRRNGELLSSNAGGVAIKADPRDVGTVLKDAGTLIDFSQPTAIMFTTYLHHLEDADDPAGLVGQYLKAAAPGSYLIISHSTQEMAPTRMRLGAEMARRVAGFTLVPRQQKQVFQMFNGHDLVEPGLVQVSYWRPDGPPAANADRVWAYGGVARL